jgi:hypothetical protein
MTETEILDRAYALVARLGPLASEESVGVVFLGSLVLLSASIRQLSSEEEAQAVAIEAVLAGTIDQTVPWLVAAYADGPDARLRPPSHWAEGEG